MSTSKEDKVRKEAQLMAKPFANWEEFLMPAPICITTLGKLMFNFADGEDVSIHKNPLQLPKSFRACLQKVNNKVWGSFNDTQAILNEIEGQFSDMPKEMAKIVLDFSQDEVGKTPSKENLEYIKKTSDVCMELTQGLNNTFSPVINMIQKLFQACENARQGYQSELNQVQRELKKVETDKKKAEQDRKQRKPQKDEAFQQYVKAIPSGWESVGIGFAQIVIDYFTNLGAASGTEFKEGDGTGLMTEVALSEAVRRCDELKLMQEEDEMNFQIYKKQNEELMKTECDIKKCEMKEEEYKKAGRILVEVLKDLRSMKEQCEKMVQFLQMTSSITESCFKEYLASVQQITNTSTVDRIYIPFRASKVAQFIHMIFQTYVKLSRSYLLPLFQQLDGIFSTKHSDVSLASEKTKLEEHCDKAKKAISSMVQQKKEEFENNLNTCEKEIKAMQPPVSEEKLKEIEGAIQQVISELSTQKENQ